MKTTEEIRSEAFRVIDNVITLKKNVFEGCTADKAELLIQLKRLEAIKSWAISNNQIQEIRHYFASKNFGQHNQFAADEISKYFYI